MSIQMFLRFTLAVLLVLSPSLASAANVNVQPLEIQATDVEVTIRAVDDSKFEVAGETVKPRKLGKAIKAANGGEIPRYVLVGGNATVGHMLAAAKAGKRAGFITVFEKDGGFRSIEALD